MAMKRSPTGTMSSYPRASMRTVLGIVLLQSKNNGNYRTRFSPTYLCQISPLALSCEPFFGSFRSRATTGITWFRSLRWSDGWGSRRRRREWRCTQASRRPKCFMMTRCGGDQGYARGGTPPFSRAVIRHDSSHQRIISQTNSLVVSWRYRRSEFLGVLTCRKDC